MSLHWMHVTAGYVLAVGGFAGMAVATALRHAAAKRTLARLDPRTARRAA